MKLLYFFLAIAGPALAQISDSTITENTKNFVMAFPDTIYHKAVFEERIQIEYPLDIRWSGFYLGALSDNTFSSNHTLNFAVKPYVAAVFRLGEKYKASLQLICPTEKGDKIIWRAELGRKLF